MFDLSSLGTITSPFGKRVAPTAGASTQHNGIDIVLSNPEIKALQGGTVIESFFNAVRGWVVRIQADDGTTHTYQHMRTQSPVTVGSSITPGTIIGTQGSSGTSTGAHLHFEIMGKDGRYIDPVSYFTAAADVGKNYWTNDLQADLQSGNVGPSVSDSITRLFSGTAQNVLIFLIVFIVIALSLFFFYKSLGG